MNEDDMRDLLHRAAPHTGGVSFADLEARFDKPGSRPRYAVVFGAAAVIVLLAVALGIAGATQHRVTSAHPTLPPWSPAQDYRSLVLHEGDQVRASGTVFARAGKPTQLCDDTAPFNQPVMPPYRATVCVVGVVVHGVELAKLHDRRSRNGVLTGRTTVHGVWTHGQLTVVSQSAPDTTDPTQVTSVPCAPPSGGWAGGGVDANKLLAWRRAHPDSIVAFSTTQLRSPSKAHEATLVLSVLTHDDPAELRKALGSFYQRKLCVRQTRYTAQQVDAAARPFESAVTRNITQRRYGYPIQTATRLALADGRPSVEIGVTRVTPQIVELAETQAHGLVHLTPWLRPDTR